MKSELWNLVFRAAELYKSEGPEEGDERAAFRQACLDCPDDAAFVLSELLSNLNLKSGLLNSGTLKILRAADDPEEFKKHFIKPEDPKPEA